MSFLGLTTEGEARIRETKAEQRGWNLGFDERDEICKRAQSCEPAPVSFHSRSFFLGAMIVALAFAALFVLLF